MKRLALFIIVITALLAVSCKPAPDPIGENTCLVDCANMAFHDCTWRITKGGEEIVPLTSKPMGSTFKSKLERGSVYRIEYSVIDHDETIASTTYELDAANALVVLMFSFDSRGVTVHDMKIGE